VLCLFPVEPAFYADHGVAAAYVGHPMADQIDLADDPAAQQAEARVALGLSPAAPTFALLPGSRVSEVELLAAPMIDAALRLRERLPEAQFVAAMANERVAESFEAAMTAVGLPRIALVQDRPRQVMAAADVVLCAAGTATLETMLVNRPLVMTYRLTRATYLMLKHLRLLQPQLFALPNILAGERLVPELIQDEANGQRLAEEAMLWLENPQLASTLRERFRDLHRQLRCDASGRATGSVRRTDAVPAATLVAGVDEAGRGPLAGPVVVAAVILDPLRTIDGLDDSKRLDERRREALFPLIRQRALAWSVIEIPAAEIDRVNVLQATLLGMRQAVEQLSVTPGLVLIDGNRRRRRPGAGHLGGLDPGQGDARPHHVRMAPSLSAVWLRAAQGLRHAGTPALTGPLRALRDSPAHVRAGARGVTERPPVGPNLVRDKRGRIPEQGSVLRGAVEETLDGLARDGAEERFHRAPLVIQDDGGGQHLGGAEGLRRRIHIDLENRIADRRGLQEGLEIIVLDLLVRQAEHRHVPARLVQRG
jgi:hypothetical protein